MIILITILFLTFLTQNISAKECGKASWYTLYGNVTASGSIMQPGNTAAHRSLPFGTKVRVTNTKNGKSVIVVINDRGPFVKNRIIDLNKTVAEQLGFRSKGIATVCIELIN